MAITRNNGYTNFNRQRILVSKEDKEEKFVVLFSWPLTIYWEKLCNVFSMHLKNLFFLFVDSGFRILRFWFQIADSTFKDCPFFSILDGIRNYPTSFPVFPSLFQFPIGHSP